MRLSACGIILKCQEKVPEVCANAPKNLLPIKISAPFLHTWLLDVVDPCVAIPVALRCVADKFIAGGHYSRQLTEKLMLSRKIQTIIIDMYRALLIKV